MAPLLSTLELTKRFPQVVANDSISFDIREGEIHFLLGENGAGKTTLVECLYGTYRPDAGKVIYRGREVTLYSPSEALRLGIGLVHQHFVLAPPLSVVENVVVGTRSPGTLLHLDRDGLRMRALCDDLGIDLDLNASVDQLSVGQQQWVEILKALYVGVQILMLDEPTAVLTPQETKRLFATLRGMKERGLSVVVVTHKLREAMELADRITVLRGGKLVATVDRSDTTEQDLARMMVGREVLLRIQKKRVEPGEPIFEVTGLSALNDRGQDALRNVGLSLRKREVLGIAGVSGNGQRELFEVLIGVRKAQKGKVLLEGVDITNRSARGIMAGGVATIPEDRISEGLVMDFSVEENLVLGRHSSAPFRKGMFLDYSEVSKFGRRCIETFGIVSKSPSQATRALSGGNLQRVILARELVHPPKVLIANQPTRGLDVGGMEFVHNSLLEQASGGAAILLISEDLDELFDLSDRIAVMFRGEIVATLKADEAGRDEVGLLMAGVREVVP